MSELELHIVITSETIDRYCRAWSDPDPVGRGGWTWYTGSAGWLYRAGLEAILGFKLGGDSLVIDPCPATGTGTRSHTCIAARAIESHATRLELKIQTT